MQSFVTAPSPRRHSELILLTAFLFLLFSVTGRLFLDYLIAPSTTLAPPPAPMESSSESFILKQQAALQRNPNNTYAYAQLGLGLLEKVRITNDPTLYTQAETAFNEALKRDPQQLDALVGQGILALARHDFTGALEWADQAWAINPFRAQTLGIMVDALVELGRYDEAKQKAQQMIELRPGVPSYTRISYLRELHGDVPGAIKAMKMARDAGVPGTEAMLWSQVQLGNLYFHSGDLEQAEAIYQEALRYRADYIHAEAALANVQAARGDYSGAIAAYEPIIERSPLPEFALTLAELYEVTGQPEKANQQYDLVRTLEQRNASAGMNVDLELALFEANLANDPAQAVELARTAYDAQPNIHAAEALSWALYQNGEYNEAYQYNQEARRLGTQDAHLYYQAGKIVLAMGDKQQAQAYLQQALDINPYFSIRDAADARRLLAQLAS